VPSTLLNWVQSLHRRVLVIHRLRAIAWLGTLLLLVLAALILLDWLVRWPWPIRTLLLAGLLVGWVRVVRSIIVSHWVQAPTLRAVALRLERLEPGLSGILTSAIEFQAAGAGAGQRLADQVIQAATRTWEGIRPARHARSIGAVVAVTLVMLIMLGVTAVMQRQPEVARIGLRRTLTPWTQDRWPSRVEIETEPLPDVVARGASIDLQARILRGERPDLRVQALCTIEDAGGRRTERRIDLTRQADGSHARNIPAEGDRFSIQLVAGDAATDVHSIRIVTAPVVVEGTIHVTPPTYASHLVKPLQASWKGLDAGDFSGVLEGSEVTLDLTLAASAPDPGTTDPARTAVTLKGGVNPPMATVTVTDPTHWQVSWPASGPAEVQVRPRGVDGVQAPSPLHLMVNTMPDRAPTVSITDPSADEIVTPQARLPFVVEARDDLQLVEAGWRVDRQQRSGEPEPVLLKQMARPVGAVEVRLEGALDMTSLQVRAGDTLLLRGTALDGMESQGSPRGIILGEPRRIRVVDAPAIEKQVRQQAESLRQVVTRLEQAQEEIQREKETATATRAQAALGERIRQAEEAASRLSNRMQRNGLQEQALAEALREAREAAAQAAGESDRATGALRQVARGDASAAPQAIQAQQGTRDELRRMGEALERDDQTMGAQRRAERIASQVERLRRDLQEASRGTEGRMPEELTSDQRQTLQTQAERQRALGEEIRSMLDDLRAAAARDGDRTESRSLQQAAEEGERSQSARRMDEAGERTDRNQTTAADQSMQAAAEGMERVQQALREDRRARTEELRRRMASLVETLKALASESDRLAGSIERWMDDRDQSTDTIESALIQVARNTGSAAEDAADGGNALRKAAGLILRSLERQQAALEAIRQSPIAAEASRDAMRRSTELLRQAIAEVQQNQKREAERQAERERKELGRTYQAMAEAILRIRETVASTLPPQGARIDRRGAATQREQGSLLQDQRQRFEQGPMASPLVSEAEVFKAIHTRVHQGMVEAGTALQDALAQGMTIRTLDGVIAGLQALAQAMQDPESGEDPFADAKTGGSPSTGGGPQAPSATLPPIAELRLVREMQAHVNRLTRDLGQARESGQSVEEAMREAGRLQDEVRRLGEDWIDRMKRSESMQRRVPAESPADPESPQDTSPSFGWNQATPPAPSPTPQAPAVGVAPVQADPPTRPSSGSSLDELLGIAGDGGATDAANQKRKDLLEKSLKQEDLDDLAKSAMESMRLASRMMVEQADGGLGTQRAQVQALADLDALLEAATRSQKQQGSPSSSSSSSSTSSRRGQPRGGDPDPTTRPASTDEQARGTQPRGPGDQARGEQQPPVDSASTTEGTLEEGRSEWGNLPPRIREILSQSRRDRVSALYQQATEAYYRRLAEERQP
jgi:hypothetical protein